jgi:RNA-binding protein
MSLTGKQRRKLRALGHHLDPVVMVGEKGVTPGVIGAAEQALYDHELIKVKLPEGREERAEAAKALSGATESEVAQLLGRTALLFKKREEDSEFEDL